MLSVVGQRVCCVGSFVYAPPYVSDAHDAFVTCTCKCMYMCMYHTLVIRILVTMYVPPPLIPNQWGRNMTRDINHTCISLSCASNPSLTGGEGNRSGDINLCINLYMSPFVEYHYTSITLSLTHHSPVGRETGVEISTSVLTYTCPPLLSTITPPLHSP